MEDCVFCKIISGDFDSAKVFEDNHIFAFLDVNPVTWGHTLVVPKKHYENLFDVDEETLTKVMVATKHIAKRVKNVLQADGVRISQSNGKEAGQAIFHFHVHIIPRYQDDGVSMSDVTTARPAKADFEELKKLAEKVRIKN